MLSQVPKSIVHTSVCLAVLVVLQISSKGPLLLLAAEPFDVAIQTLRTVTPTASSQIPIKNAWDVAAGGGADRLISVLEAMNDVGPLAENWLRAVIDAIAERELRSSGNLPVADLEKFILDSNQAPRARRSAFEWLTQVDNTAPDRLLPAMLDDPSLEIRHDAVARLIAEAQQTTLDSSKLKKVRLALSSSRSLDQMKLCIELLQELGEVPNLAEYFGYVTAWHGIGPFDNTGGVGFDQVYPPEAELDFAKQYQGKHGTVSWFESNAEGQEIDNVGVVDVNEMLDEEKGVVAYVAAVFVSPKEQVLECRYGTVNATKLWVNGELLIEKDIYHMGGEFDQYIASAKFRRGENIILLKICQNEQTDTWARQWDFRLRVTDHLGGGIGQAAEPK